MEVLELAESSEEELDGGVLPQAGQAVEGCPLFRFGFPREEESNVLAVGDPGECNMKLLARERGCCERVLGQCDDDLLHCHALGFVDGDGKSKGEWEAGLEGDFRWQKVVATANWGRARVVLFEVRGQDGKDNGIFGILLGGNGEGFEGLDDMLWGGFVEIQLNIDGDGGGCGSDDFTRNRMEEAGLDLGFHFRVEFD